MIITVGGIKGGTGKTTIAAQLAVISHHAGARTLLVDGDRQETATEFTLARADELGASGFTGVRLDHRAMRSQLPALALQFDVVIVDVGGTDSMAQREALLQSEKVVTPFAPSSFDIWTLHQVRSLIDEVRTINRDLEWIGCLNLCRIRGNKDAEAAIETMRGVELACCGRIHSRKAIADACGSGLGISELRPLDVKACAEIYHFAQHVLDPVELRIPLHFMVA